MTHDLADARELAAVLRARLAELDADHRDRTQSLRDDLRRVEAMLARDDAALTLAAAAVDAEPS